MIRMRISDTSCWRGCSAPHTCDMAHSFLWNDQSIRVKRPIHMCGVSHAHLRQKLLKRLLSNNIRATWLIHMCDMPHSFMWWLVCAPQAQVVEEAAQRYHTRDMTHSYVSCVWYDSFIHVIWLIHTCDMTHSYLWCLACAPQAQVVEEAARSASVERALSDIKVKYLCKYIHISMQVMYLCIFWNLCI